MEKFYLSTALPYVNQEPHIGFALEIIQADVIARYCRRQGKKVFFLTGSDENSLKNVQAAKERGISVEKLINLNAKKFYHLKYALNLSFDDFIRTTQKRHLKGVQKLWLACKKDIFKKKYKGLYCVGCEEFYKKKELKKGFCPEHKIKPAIIEEEDYFFRLSKYQKPLKKIFKENEIKILPEKLKEEVLDFIESGLEDICISRQASRAKGWGVDVPGDPSQKIWVWLDALSGYISALGYGEDEKRFQDWWQKNKNKLHIIGKGILRFHAIYWPALLLSAKLALPSHIFVHGYITVSGQKMSKSLGNVVSPFELAERYGIDPTRYFLLREISPTKDGDFTYEKFEARYNSDLAKGLGNLVARILEMAKNLKIDPQRIFFASLQDLSLSKKIKETWERWEISLNEFKFNESLIAIWELISFSDHYIDKKRPWRFLRSNIDRGSKIIFDLLVTLRNIAQMLEIFLPETSNKILSQIKTKKRKLLFPLIR